MRQFSTKAFGLFHRIFAAGSRPGGLRLELRLTLAALLLAAATFGGVFFGVAQAQDANGAITGLTLTSDSPGTLVVSWDMPSPAPSDYRVDWAKSSESYQSYKVDEGHVYPEGSLTTVTITDLEAGAEYKVRMRARYNQGEHADSPWSGPWAGSKPDGGRRAHAGAHGRARAGTHSGADRGARGRRHRQPDRHRRQRRRAGHRLAGAPSAA